LRAAFAGHGDQTAFAELVECHGSLVLRDRQGAEEMAQAVFLALAKGAIHMMFIAQHKTAARVTAACVVWPSQRRRVTPAR
jgi:hypothetical protein